MKKLLYVLSLLLIASMVLTACGGGQPAATEAPAEEATEAATEAPEATEAPATEAPSGDKVQIRWFVGLGTGTDPAQLPAQEKAVADFNA